MDVLGVDYETTPVGFFDKGPKAKRLANSKGHPRLARPTFLAMVGEQAHVIADPGPSDFPRSLHLVMFNAVFDLLVAQVQQRDVNLSLLYSQSFDDVLAMTRVLGEP